MTLRSPALAAVVLLSTWSTSPCHAQSGDDWARFGIGMADAIIRGAQPQQNQGNIRPNSTYPRQRGYGNPSASSGYYSDGYVRPSNFNNSWARPQSSNYSGPSYSYRPSTPSYSQAPAPPADLGVSYSHQPIKLHTASEAWGAVAYTLSAGEKSWNYTMTAGQKQTFKEDRTWRITYHDGFEMKTYSLQPGDYVFRRTGERWQIYKGKKPSATDQAFAGY